MNSFKLGARLGPHTVQLGEMPCYCLGNVREVVSEPGEVKQVNAYYPFGTPIHALGINESQQRYKYNGKAFDELHGLNTYDYGARQYAPLLPLWDRVDPLAEKYYGVFGQVRDNPTSINSK